MLIVTLNTWKADGRYVERLNRMVAELRALRPDVVLLQECFAAPDHDLDTAAELASALGFQAARYPSRIKPRRIGGQGDPMESWAGLATLHRGAVLEDACIRLPEHPGDGRREALLTLTQTKTARVALCNLHLTHLPEAHALRFEQALCAFIALNQAVKDWRADAWVMGGDFNALPESVTLRGLAEVGARSVFDILGHDEPATLFAKEAQLPLSGTVDYLMTDARVASAQRVMDTLRPLAASDHAGLLASLEV